MNPLIRGNPFSTDLAELIATILVRPIKKCCDPKIYPVASNVMFVAFGSRH